MSSAEEKEELSNESSEDILSGLIYDCDRCCSPCEIEVFCSDGFDAIYCSKECQEEDKDDHSKVCVCNGNVFAFCVSCSERVCTSDLCSRCKLNYICEECKGEKEIKDFPDVDVRCCDECGVYEGLTVESIEEFITSISTNPEKIDYFMEESRLLTEEDESIGFVVTYLVKNGKIQEETQQVDRLDIEDSVYGKFVMLESILEMNAFLSDPSFVMKFPYVMEFLDEDSETSIYECMCYLNNY